MALSAKTLKVLKDAGLEPADVALFSDEDLLGLPGVGPAVLADIRVMYPAPVASVTMAMVPEVVIGQEMIEAATVAVEKRLDKAPAQPAVVSASPEPAAVPTMSVAPGCTCDQPFRVTRTRQRAGRTERYCDACGAVQASAGGRS